MRSAPEEISLPGARGRGAGRLRRRLLQDLPDAPLGELVLLGERAVGERFRVLVDRAIALRLQVGGALRHHHLEAAPLERELARRLEPDDGDDAPLRLQALRLRQVEPAAAERLGELERAGDAEDLDQAARGGVNDAGHQLRALRFTWYSSAVTTLCIWSGRSHSRRFTL